MKTFLMMAAFCAAAVISHAQGLKNKTNCALRVIPVCHTPGGGASCGGGTCGTGVLVAAQSSLSSLPVCSTPCPDPNVTGYMIVYDMASTGCNMSATVGNYANPCPPQYPVSNVLPPCPGCGNRLINIYYVGHDIMVEY